LQPRISRRVETALCCLYSDICQPHLWTRISRRVETTLCTVVERDAMLEIQNLKKG